MTSYNEDRHCLQGVFHIYFFQSYGSYSISEINTFKWDDNTEPNTMNYLGHNLWMVEKAINYLKFVVKEGTKKSNIATCFLKRISNS